MECPQKIATILIYRFSDEQQQEDATTFVSEASKLTRQRLTG